MPMTHRYDYLWLDTAMMALQKITYQNTLKFFNISPDVIL